MQVFGKGLRQAVSHRFDHDGAVGVVRLVKLLGKLVRTVNADGEATDEVGAPALLRCDVVAQREVGFVLLDLLLPKRVENGLYLAAGIIGVHLDVISDGVGREEAEHATRVEAVLLHDLIQQQVGIDVELLRLFDGFDLHLLVFVIGGKLLRLAIPTPAQFPRMEEGRPIDVLTQGRDDVGPFKDSCACELGRRDLLRGPVTGEGFFAGFGQREQLALLLLAVFLAEADVARFIVGDKLRLLIIADQGRGNGNAAAGIEHVDDGARVVLGNLDRGVRGTGGGTAH